MKNCKDCREGIPTTAVVDGVKRRLTNRSRCLSCQPYRTSPYARRYGEGEARPKSAPKVKRWRLREIARTGEDPVTVFRQARKRFIVDILGGCQFCGYSRAMRNLAFHHVGRKSFAVSERSFQLSAGRVLPEIRECVLSCHNCHGEIHDGIIPESSVLEAWGRLKESLSGVTALPTRKSQFAGALRPPAARILPAASRT